MKNKKAFTLVEMLMALLIISIVLSASIPVISSRQKAIARNYDNSQSFPIGGIIIWQHETMPDSTWLECNGQSIPPGIEYKQAQLVFGSNLPNYQGLFLRGHGSQTFTQNNGANIGNTATTHSSDALGVIQGDSARKVTGNIAGYTTGGTQGIFYNADGAFTPSNRLAGTPQGSISSELFRYTIITLDTSLTTPTSAENRPVNIAVKYIAKVKY